MLNITDNLKNNFASRVQKLIDFFNENNFEDAIFYGNFLLEKFPENPLLNNIIGLSYYALGNSSKAKSHFQACIRIEKNFFEGYNNLGVIYNNLNYPKKAKQLFQEAIMIKSNYADAYYNLGIAEKKLSNNEKAYNNFRKAYKFNKTNEKVVHAYSEILISLDKQEKAILVLEKFVINNSNSFISYHLIGQLYEQKQQYDDAIENYKKAILVNENFLPSISNIGKIYSDQDKNKLASVFFEKGMKIINKFNFNLKGCLNFCFHAGMFFFRIKKLDKSYRCFEIVIKLDPSFKSALVNKYQIMREMCDWSEFEIGKKEFSKLNNTNLFIDPYSMLIQYDDPSLQKLIAKNYSSLNFDNERLNLDSLLKESRKKIRIGYFSADFVDHPVSKLLYKMISLHDRNNFEIYCYSFKSKENCEIQNHFKNNSDSFLDAEKLTNKEIVNIARKDKIHIGIDLMGYTKGARTEIFSLGVAPIQINYLGYSSTMGSTFIDYIIADKTTIPKKNEKFFTEKIIRLPNSFMPTNNNEIISIKSISRRDAGLPKKGIVFCSFNKCSKICPDVFGIWMEILLEIKGSVLWLSEPNNWAKINLIDFAKKRGVDSSRIVFAKKIFIEDHYKRHQLADLFLDTFDYNSHSTAVDCLWSGLPLITKIGKGFQARIASSLLISIGLKELITNNEKEYKETILKFARNPKSLVMLKQKLANNLAIKPLFKSEDYTKNFEKALKDLLKKH